ncbi:MAG: hypothetical protein A2W90_05205 [Bacteroidetes bacterium GWF2_42_66]|nr:MAG: hypothetical protein A2W92_03380 [Bacteroidetes bacterium GWA2_42_15]OFX95978.1 MAG: hypothetical protein A2W89_02615 [Bacteroidetes bacterium GWE2_42_39]OFY46551.1 MAG: hypothetical protein A2W90_05205 [Bacteroidetes bacterium GWF2_42_66]HBL75594.1 hypothetical protein [Prolixibacteraceae bacterium]HCR91035.1 hypothetical protein [Prolixibacteraceae bacterium]
MKIILLILPVIMLTVGEAVGTNKVIIMVNNGSFASAEAAAFGEEQVDFWDGDFQDDRACTECFAAVELKKYLVKITDIKEGDIILTGVNKFPDRGDVFILGSRESNPPVADGDVQFASEQSFKISTKTDKGRIITRVQGSDRIGTLYGVYYYLNKLGIQFYGLGETGTVYPTAAVSITADMSVVENPSYLTRGFNAWGDRKCDDEFFLWMARNRVNLWASQNQPVALLKKLGMKFADGSHDMHNLYLNPEHEYSYDHPKFEGDGNKPEDPYNPSDEYKGDIDGNGKLTNFEAHPEWYGLHDGKRSNNIAEWEGDNFCTSNADARKELTKNFVQDIIDGQKSKADIVRVGMLDNGKWCECETCKNSGNYTSRSFTILNDLLEGIELARSHGRLNRKVHIQIAAYSETLSPPDRPLPESFDYENISVSFAPIERCYCHSFADPACSEINAKLLKDYQNWVTGEGRNYKGAITFTEYYNISSLKSLPTLYTKVISADIPWYYRNGARHFRWMHTPTKLWGTWTLTQNLLSKLLWNVDTDVNKFLDEYFSLYYPTTTEHAKKFYEHLEIAMIQTKSFKHFVFTPKGSFSFRSWTGLITGEKKNIFSLDHMKYEKYSPVINDGPDMVEIIDHLRLARMEIDAALVQCHNDKEQSRLIDDERRFAYGESMINFFYHLVRTAIFHNTENTVLAKHEFTQVKKYAEELKQVKELVQVASDDSNAENGFVATQMVDVYELYENRYGLK